MQDSDRFWRKSYDPGLSDIDPGAWETTLVEVCTPSFQKLPNKIALAFLGVHVTFDELDRYANRFAHLLLNLGLKKGEVVGINLPNIPEYVIAMLGTARAGGVSSGVSPLLSSEELDYQLRDSRAKVLVTLDALYEHRLASIAPRLPDLQAVITTSIGGFLPSWKRMLGQCLGRIPTGKIAPLPGKIVYPFKEILRTRELSEQMPSVHRTPDDIAFLMYTGGTTGIPKGAMLSHRNVVSNLMIIRRWFGFEHGAGVLLSGFPFFHIGGLGFNCLGIYLGLQQILIPNPRDTDHICAELKKYRPTHMGNVPSLYMLLMANARFKALDHSRLETCICAAAPFPEKAQQELEGIVGRGKIVEFYGMTETSSVIASNPVKGQKKLGSVGLPLLNTRARLIDPFTRRAVAVGEPGELCIKGPQVMVGYFNRPDETTTVIDRDGYLHTGDVAVQDQDGYLRIVDRTKDMIIVSGFKVFSTKVEGVLSRHPAVDMVVIVGLDNPERPGSEIVKAYATLKPAYQNGNIETIRQDILSFAQEKLAPYEVPKLMEFRDQLPLTVVGKIDKKALRSEACHNQPSV